MSKITKEYDERGNCIHQKYFYGFEQWTEYDENNNLIHIKNSDEFEEWYGYDKNNKQIKITKQEFEKIKEQEFLGRKYCSRFELMDI